MTRTFRRQADEQILDSAAALFARHGFEHTSVQAVADAVGLSKAGLLHHYPSKDALRAAVITESTRLGQQVVDQVDHLPLGAARDHRALEAMADFALAHPGTVALLLAPITQGGSQDGAVEEAGATALRAFGVVDPASTSTERTVRVVGALAALAVLTIAAYQHGQTIAWRPFVLATCYDALGHCRPGTGASRSDQVEA